MNKALCLLLFVASCFRGFAADSAIPEPDVSFFTKLRMDYSQRKDFEPRWESDPAHEAVVAAYDANDYKRVVTLSKVWLATCPVDANGHMMLATAAKDLGDLKTYMHHLFFAYGLMQSVMQSGDGLTPKTAFKVISVSEEYSVIFKSGADITNQSLVGGPCDKMDCKLPNGKAITLYFDVSIPMKALPK